LVAHDLTVSGCSGFGILFGSNPVPGSIVERCA
jgi:hypothetical protein